MGDGLFDIFAIYCTFIQYIIDGKILGNKAILLTRCNRDEKKPLFGALGVHGLTFHFLVLFLVLVSNAPVSAYPNHAVLGQPKH